MTTTTNASVSSIYTVQLGDTLSKIAQRFFGDATRANDIATANGVGVNDILPFGKAIKIPAGAANTSAAVESGEPLEEIIATATKYYWYKDWRVWAGVVALGGLFMYMNKSGRKRR